MGKSCSFDLQYVFCTMSRENNSLNKGDVYICRLHIKIKIKTRVSVQVVRMIRLTEGLFDKSRMKRPDKFEAMKSMNFPRRNDDHGRPWSPRFLMVYHVNSWSTIKYRDKFIFLTMVDHCQNG